MLQCHRSRVNLRSTLQRPGRRFPVSLRSPLSTTCCKFSSEKHSEGFIRKAQPPQTLPIIGGGVVSQVLVGLEVIVGHRDRRLNCLKFRRPTDNNLTCFFKIPSRTMLSCARAAVSRALFRPSLASRSLATVSTGNVDTSGIPVVDFAHFGSLSFDQRRETARQVVDGFKSMGFVYLANHGISDGIVQEAFKRVCGPIHRTIRAQRGMCRATNFSNSRSRRR